MRHHRPDPLVEPDEVAEAFDQLHSQGKVKYFGVSNHTPAQIELLQRSLPHKLIVNQIQLSIAHTPVIDSGVSFNMKVDQSINRDSSIVDYCRLNNITLQAWSPFQHGFFKGPFDRHRLDRTSSGKHSSDPRHDEAGAPARRLQKLGGNTDAGRMVPNLQIRWKYRAVAVPFSKKRNEGRISRPSFFCAFFKSSVCISVYP